MKIRNQLGVREQYKPIMCADCKCWQDNGTRDLHGRKGECILRHEAAYRTDWCHEPEEIERHELAMRLSQGRSVTDVDLQLGYVVA